MTFEPTSTASGVVLFELLAGVRPFEGRREDVLRQLREADPPTMHERFLNAKAKGEAIASARDLTPRVLLSLLESDLGTIPLMAIQRAPSDRYPDVRALADDVQRWLAGDTVKAARGGWRYGRAEMDATPRRRGDDRRSPDDPIR